jgi:hypothetical protein
MPFSIASGATEVADPIERAEAGPQNSHGERVAVKLGPMVERVERRCCGLAQKDDGEQAKTLGQLFGMRRRAVGFAPPETASRCTASAPARKGLSIGARY